MAFSAFRLFNQCNIVFTIEFIVFQRLLESLLLGLLCLHFLDDKVFVEELGQDLLREFTPELGEEVSREEALRRLVLRVNARERGDAEHIIVNQANLSSSLN